HHLRPKHARHLGDVRALAAQQLTHLARPFSEVHDPAPPTAGARPGVAHSVRHVSSSEYAGAHTHSTRSGTSPSLCSLWRAPGGISAQSPSPTLRSSPSSTRRPRPAVTRYSSSVVR